MNNPEKQTILITGASSGIGEETAYKLAKTGACLILCARNVEKLNKVKATCEIYGAHQVIVFPLDLTQSEMIDQLICFLEEAEIHVDVLINNAGFGYAGAFSAMDFQTVNNLFEVNVLSLMYLTQQIALRMLDQKQGQIINMASLAGKVATPDYAIYAATKAAVISFSNALWMELKPFNIQVTVVNFGPVATPFFDQIEGDRKDKALNSFFTLTTQEAAKTLVKAVGKNKREINRPRLLNIGAVLYKIVPSLSHQILLKYF